MKKNGITAMIVLCVILVVVVIAMIAVIILGGYATNLDSNETKPTVAQSEETIDNNIETTEPIELETEPNDESEPIETEATETSSKEEAGTMETQETITGLETETNVDGDSNDSAAMENETSSAVVGNGASTGNEETSVENSQTEPSATEPIEEVIIVVNELEPYVEENFPDDGAIVYTTGEVNVRAEPYLSAEILGRLEKGARVFRYDTTTNGWSRIYYNDKVAYVSNKYINPYKIEPFELYEEVDETVYAGHDVNIRLIPSALGPSAGKLKQGESIRRIGIGKNGWSQVIYKNQLFFINSLYLSTDPDFVIPLEWFLAQENKGNTTNGTNGN